jgi:hypothetical protein
MLEKLFRRLFYLSGAVQKQQRIKRLFAALSCQIRAYLKEILFWELLTIKQDRKICENISLFFNLM